MDRNKHILVVSQCFYPEQFRVNDICLEWKKRGYKVSVLTGIPNYPQGKFFDGYGYSKRRKEFWNGVEIIRIPLIPRGHSSIGLILNYLSFVVSGFFWKIFTQLKVDFIFIYETSPMTQALIGVWYAKKVKIPCYLYVTDLWPENVEVITGIHNRAVIGCIQGMVDYIYKRSTKILTSSYSFIEAIKARNVSDDRIEFWPQYAEDFYRPIQEQQTNEIPSDDIFNFVFAGNLGYAQGLQILVKAAEQLKKEDLNVRFNVIGDGRYKNEFLSQIQSCKVAKYFNIIDRKLPEEIPQYLAKADVLLITLSRSKVFSITIPAKTQSCMACGKPILVSADGEVQKIISDANAGLVGDAEDCATFVANIKKFIGLSQDELERYGENALRYSREHFDKIKLLDRIDKIFMEEI